MSDLTPMMRQYLEIKADYPDTILFFRMGDFYEMFLDDAVKASRILDIALTSRNKSADGADVPLCGVPYHSVTPYIARMIEAGEKVAICEQVEDPKTAKGIVKRRVVKVVTPGLVVDTESLTPKENNYLLAIFAGSGNLWGLACLDLSTGEFRVTELATADAAVAEVVCVNPREIILPASFRDSPRMKELATATGERIITYLDDWVFDTDYAHRLITGHFGVASPDALGCAGLKEGVPAAGAILHYLNETQMGKAGHIRTIIPYKTGEYLALDDSTRRNLELTATLAEGKRKGSLLGLMDRTATAMGGRKLRQWINYPLVSVDSIVERQDAVDELLQDPQRRGEIALLLNGVYDLERLNGRISLASASAKDLVALKESLWPGPGHKGETGRIIGPAPLRAWRKRPIPWRTWPP